MKTNLVLIYQRYGPVDTNLAKDNQRKNPKLFFYLKIVQTLVYSH